MWTDIGNIERIMIVMAERKNPPGRSGLGLKGNIKMNAEEINY
jgi:hypothetical protein